MVRLWQGHPVLLAMVREWLEVSPHLREDKHKDYLAELLLDQAGLKMFE
jgi:hypothetical protein